MISSTNLISFYFIRDTGRASSQPSGNLSHSFPDGIPVGNLIPLMRREFPMGSHNLLFGYRFLSCSDPKLNLGGCRSKKDARRQGRLKHYVGWLFKFLQQCRMWTPCSAEYLLHGSNRQGT